MAPVGSCGRRAMGLLLPRCPVRKGVSVASGSVREFERTGGREPRVAPRTYSEVAGRPADAPQPQGARSQAAGPEQPASGAAEASATEPTGDPTASPATTGCCSGDAQIQPAASA